MSSYQKILTHREIRRRAARIRNWYLDNRGRWLHLTQAEAQRMFRAFLLVRKADIDEELDLDGI